MPSAIGKLPATWTLRKAKRKSKATVYFVAREVNINTDGFSPRMVKTPSKVKDTFRPVLLLLSGGLVFSKYSLSLSLLLLLMSFSKTPQHDDNDVRLEGDREKKEEAKIIIVSHSRERPHAISYQIFTLNLFACTELLNPRQQLQQTVQLIYTTFPLKRSV